nr:uncharacterized protein LOC115262874 [Aedes albopictus]
MLSKTQDIVIVGSWPAYLGTPKKPKRAKEDKSFNISDKIYKQLNTDTENSMFNSSTVFCCFDEALSAIATGRQGRKQVTFARRYALAGCTTWSIPVYPRSEFYCKTTTTCVIKTFPRTKVASSSTTQSAKITCRSILPFRKLRTRRGCRTEMDMVDKKCADLRRADIL